MARNGTKTGGRNFKKGDKGNPGGYTKEQARVKHLTRETLKDLMNLLNTATFEDMQRLLGKQDTPALSMMITKGYMNAMESGDWRQIEGILQRLVGKVEDKIEIKLPKATVIKRRDGSEVVLGLAKKDDDDEDDTE